MKYTKEYINEIFKSVDSTDFKSLIIEKIDILKNGRLSCAFFVSSILHKFNFIDSPHCTVKTTIEKMKDYDWIEINLEDIEVGDVILWDKKRQGTIKKHFHIGFYIGNEKAISNSWKKRSPQIHSWNYNGKRKILKVFRKVYK